MKHTESNLVKACCNLARKKGLAAVKLEKNGNKGIPDYMFIQEGGKTLFVEFKRPDGKGVLSEEQKFWRKFLGYSCVIIDNENDFIRHLMLYFEV